jgi:hypothetical protein
MRWVTCRGTQHLGKQRRVLGVVSDGLQAGQHDDHHAFVPNE